MNYKSKQVLISLIIVSIIIFSGCTETTIQSGKQIISKGTQQITESYTELSKNLPDSINKLYSYLKEKSVDLSQINPENPDVILFIANLEPINDDSLDFFEAYHAITDNANTIITILDREGSMDIGFKGTREEYQRVSKIVTKWSPIIDNYNNLIFAARAYNESNPETMKEYYKCLGLFCVEISIIYSHVWWKPTYAVIGKIYQGSGLNRLAFKCPSVISAVLSMAHWNLRNYLTDQTTASAEWLLDNLTTLKILPQIQDAFEDK